MEFKTYKVKQGQWGGVIDSTITIPEGLKLITGGPNSIGHGLHDGLFHYLGIIKSDLDTVYNGLDGLHVSAKAFDEYVIVTIHDIRFIDEYPYLITADELNSEFDLTDYLTVTWSSNLRLMNMKRIVRIDSEFDIKVVVVTNRDYFDQDEMLSLSIDNLELDNIITSGLCLSDNGPLGSKIVKGLIANSYFVTLIHNVTSKVEIYPSVRLVDINQAHNLFEAGEYESLDEYITMKKVKYLD